MSESNSAKELSSKLEKASSTQQQIKVIKNFIIPSTKEGLFEIMLLAYSNFDPDYYANNLEREDVSDAWLSMIERCHEKAKLCLQDCDYQKLNELYDKIQKVCKQTVHRTTHSKKVKKLKPLIITLVSVIVPIVLITLLVLGCCNVLNPDPNYITIGISPSSVQEQDYHDIVGFLEKQGFTNITTRKAVWGISNPFKKENTIKSITINGRDDFVSFAKFHKDSKIVIVYYGPLIS